MSSNLPGHPAFQSEAPAGTAWGRIDGTSMGTSWTVKYLGASSDAARQELANAVQRALDGIVEQMSTWESDSIISTLNRAEAGWYQLPPAFFYVLRHALNLAELSGGAYDPTLGRLTDLWGFGANGRIEQPPSQDEVNSAMALCGWRLTELNHEHQGVWQPGGLQFDLSSIAKGYGVDEIARVLDRHGVLHYLAELGGELKTRGFNARGTRWEVDIEAPDQSGANLPVLLADCALATSGDYRRCFEHGGQRYAHTLDPRTGQPLRHCLESVSVVHEQCMMADGLATALLCMGTEKGLAYARRNSIAAAFIARAERGLAVEMTDKFRDLAESGLSQG